MGVDAVPTRLLCKRVVVSVDEGDECVFVCICDAGYFFDVIVECDDVSVLEYLRNRLGIDSSIIISGVFGSPLLVVNTFSDLSSAKEFFYQFEDILVGGMI